MRNEPGAQPLAGIKVLDFSRVLAGPWCAMVLADLGAEVIKVEHPRRGDDTRDWGLRVGDTETTYFNSVNRSKRSICVDLQTEAGRRIARGLAAQADVVVHNFKAGGAEKLGLGYDALAALNPRLVHCAISGYDRSGPEASRPGYDLVVQGEAGLMALNGEAGRPPLKFGVAVADLFTGMYSAQAILAALYERHATGRGRRIEMALFDCGLMVTSYYGLEALLMGEDPPRYGNAHPSIVPYGVFDAADGPIVITVGNNAQFARFCDVIGRPELAADARFATNIARSANRAELLPEILRELGRRPRAALLAALADAGIPCGEVLGLREALTSERAQSAGLVTRQPHPAAGEVDVLAPPYRFDGERLPVRGAPPVLGADTERVLGDWLGMSAREIAQLRSDRVV
ncbi:MULTISPECIES: CaiB/BaiF CoA-transferase family protein [Burkholderia]|uniref:CoA transferase n=3 Tax=Burkholderia humptydooensis TaxID=430531 RepID=A0A7U4P6J2_9BURK|nr:MULTISPECIES: CaiB/BaiF CoA-transferase family protein [Burkholderia]AGK47012.1 coA-transferase III family protein [Burkholderia thailandensis MSMB121]ATF34984.1 CoA transferase [Burkholderia thailandensis]AJY42075.1 coA-transferase III family protein [Burkholderia sp. 2002721687]ALX43867.1 CoA-transferase [Burkholderia humptydooensis]EIP89784.1 CAIB/BAIF family protein [Burkholderia humptydooensis MSMB43]